MKFKLSTSGCFYSIADAKKLEAIGITCEADTSATAFKDKPRIKKRTSMSEIEIGSLEELMAFAEKWGQLIVSHNPPEIEIYDDVRE